MPQLPKQLIWSVLLWLIVCTSVWSEDDLTITVVPEAPTTNSNISITVADLYKLGKFNNAGGTLFLISSEYILEGNIIKIFINTGRSVLSLGVPSPTDIGSIITSTDIELGILPAGSYELELYLSITFSKGAASNPQLIQKSSFSVSSNIHSIPSLSSIGIILLTLTIAIFGGRHRLQQKYSKFTSI